MIWALIGLALGVLAGVFIPYTYPDNYSLYISVAILAAIDSIFGGIVAMLEDRYENRIFVAGFFSNALLAGLLSYLGDRLGIPFYYAPIIVFGGRLFQNFSAIRHHLMEK